MELEVKHRMRAFRKTHRKHSQSRVRCPVCDNLVADIRYIYDQNQRRSNFYACKTCSFIFANPQLIPELKNRQMDGVDNAEMFQSALLKRLYKQLIIKTEILKLKRYQFQNVKNKILDVGCGTGWTSHIYSTLGFNVTGLEPSPVRADIARKKYGLNVYEDYIENISVKGTYHYVLLRQFLEHISEPKKIINGLKRFIDDDGIFVVVVPNINCLGRYLFDTDWEWVLPYHCSFFSEKSLKALFESCGCEILECYQTPSPLYFTESLLRTIGNEKLTDFVIKRPLIGRMISSVSSIIGTSIGLGDNITIMARNKGRG